MPEENTQDPQGQSIQPTATSQDVTANVVETSAPATQEELPEKFKDKSAADIAKAYSELEKTIGKHSTEAQKAKANLQQWELLGKVIEKNPTLYAAVEAELKTLGGSNRDTTVNDPASTQRDDTRIATENMVIGRFEETFGIDKLPSEQREALHKSIAQELAEIVDPGGELPVSQAVKKIPLNKLHIYLDKAYKMATLNNSAEQARFKGMLEARQNSEAAFGSMPSSSISSNSKTLSSEEQAVARKMGISDEAYLKQKQALNS
jgi:phage I-like protein